MPNGNCQGGRYYRNPTDYSPEVLDPDASKWCSWRDLGDEPWNNPELIPN